MAQVLPFTETDLKAAAGPSVFALGVDRLSRVTDLETGDGEITATVSGEYEVSLTIEVGPRSGIVTLYADCPCPAGLEDDFCEHCVAVGLAALRHSAARDRDLLVSWLTSLTKDELVAEILGLADDDEELGHRLASKAAGRAADPGRTGNAVRRLLKPDGGIGREYADSVYQAANMIDSLIDEDGDAIGLTRAAFAWVKEASARSGYASPLIAEAARELLASHLRACDAADPAPDPVELGTYLADLLVHDDFGVTPSLEEYSGLLGREGTLAIRDRIKAVHEAEPGNRNARHLTETILKAEGDTDALAAFYRDELDSNLNEIESLKTASGDDAYRRLARLLAEARECHVALGTTGQFTQYMSQLRADLKRRRNLMKILDENGL
ncbi:MAG: SWIM zinc finger family protein [Trebonia sp.]